MTHTTGSATGVDTPTLECNAPKINPTRKKKMPEYQMEIMSPARPKARPRSAAGKRPYMPKKYMEWKEAFAKEAKLRGIPLLDEPVSLSVALSRESTIIRVSTLGYADKTRAGLLTGDVDNYCGGVMDALEGIAWTNDRLIFNLKGDLV